MFGSWIVLRTDFNMNRWAAARGLPDLDDCDDGVCRKAYSPLLQNIRKWHSSVHDSPADQRQYRFDFPDLLFSHTQIVITQDDQIGVLPLRKRPNMVLIEREPRCSFCVQTKRLDARDLLAVIRQHARKVSSGCHIEERQPRIKRRDIC